MSTGGSRVQEVYVSLCSLDRVAISELSGAKCSGGRLSVSHLDSCYLLTGFSYRGPALQGCSRSFLPIFSLLLLSALGSSRITNDDCSSTLKKQ